MSSLVQAVVVATTGRRMELLRRALLSVQLARARIVVVVDATINEAASAIAELRSTYPHIDVLRNRRTPGASGAWNSAIDHLLRSHTPPSNVLVSFLDDDDYWASGYLDEIHAVALSTDAEVFGATLVRHDSESVEGRAYLVDRLVANDFLVGNPGLQQTNVSIRLATLAEAGCFNEALPSCTDRDLFIRLADLGARYVAAPNAVAHHDTLHGFDRLSDPSSPSKRAGLDAFFAIHRERMTTGERLASAERASRLFGWEPPPEQGTESRTVTRVRPTASATKLRLVVGMVVDGARPARALPLIDDLARLSFHSSIEGLDLVLLQNGDAAGFSQVTERATSEGLRTWLVGLEVQRCAGRELGLVADELGDAKTIAVARTLLQRAVHSVAESRPGAVAWILDDDLRISIEPEELVAVVDEARTRKLGVAIGDVVGAPPLPSGSTLRVQLVDVLNMLVIAAARDPNDPAPSPAGNARWLHARHDHYYDLARNETDRLETPFIPESSAVSIEAALRALIDGAPRILAGELVTRIMQGHDDNAWQPTHIRGGNTLVLDLELLRDIANLSPSVHGRRVRRSDMIWATHADRSFGKLVARAPIALTQDRTMDPAVMEDPRKLVDDILGYAFFRAYEGAPGSTPDELRALTRKFATERLAAYRLSFFRSRGVVRAVRTLIGQKPWWAQDRSLREKLEAFLVSCDDALTDSRLEAVVRGVSVGMDHIEIEAFLEERDRLCQPNAPALASLASWTRGHRETQARELIRTIGAEVDEVLGMGSEGVVVRTGDRVFKVFDAWSRLETRIHVDRLRALALVRCTAFPAISTIHLVRDVAVLEYRYEQSEPYRGGNGPALLSALRALRAGGWIHTNIHPKNLRVTASGAVRIVDLGRSVIAHTDADEELMVRRAFLAWRFFFRSDLDELMRASLTADTLIELVGWRALLEGVRELPAKERLDIELRGLLASSTATQLLDFGAGKPRQIHVEGSARSWFAFDPDPELRARWGVEAPGVRFLDELALEALLADGTKVDAIVCSLVLCALDDQHAAQALARVRAILDRDGLAWIVVCDPLSIHVEVTSDFERRSSSIAYGSRGCYAKLVHESGVKRLEHHRPLADYRRAFARAGFQIDSETTIDATDALRFERISEFRVFKLRPLEALPCTASLLLKVCGMDAETMKAQIEHVVRQMGRPRAFSETVVVLDPRSDGFARSHRVSDLPRVRAELACLLDARVIDRVVEGPLDGGASRTLASDWFGIDAVASHAANGQAALAVLAGISACRSDLVFHADVDVLIARPDDAFDLIRHACDVFERSPDTVALSLPVYGDADPTVRDGDTRGPFRVDAVCGWLHRGRLLALRPLANEAPDGVLALPWHRSLDRAVRGGPARSVRAGGLGIWFAHPDNARKSDADRHLLLLDRVEANVAPLVQVRCADMRGSFASWCGPARTDGIVVVVTGRNVSPGRIRRCVESLRAQSHPDWSVIFIDDASDNGGDEVLVDACHTLGDRTTLVKRRRRVGLLANLTLAVRHLIVRREAIVVTLDLDDALADHALARIVRAYEDGADVTVGSMIRTDKEIEYVVDFSDPRGKRGGNVWQHARSFRKSLFDQIDERDLQIDGKSIDLATDWAFMLPLVELATHPVWIREPLYLHEPSLPRDNARRLVRDRNIGAIVRKPAYRGRAEVPALTVFAYHRFAERCEPIPNTYRSRGMVVSPANLEAQLRVAARYFEPVRLSDVERAFNDGHALPPRALLVTVDDGYRDVERALPILSRLGFPVALFARVPAVDGLPAWAPLDLWYHARAVSGARAIVPSERDALLAWPLGDQLGYACAGVARDLCDTWRRALYLSGGQLRDLAAPDVELGAHGVEHVRWTNLDDEALRDQIERSLNWLSTVPNAVRALAYPDGCVDARVARITEVAGGSVGFTIGNEGASVRPRFAIRRLVPSDSPTWVDEVLARAEVEA